SRAKPEEVGSEDLKPIIDESIALVEKEMTNLNIELAFYHEEVPPVKVSASKIQQLLLNLLINAQHAIKKHGVITIALMREGDNIQVRVGDSGSGIEQSHLVKVFDPFFSTKGVWGKDEVIGTGMGLAICRNIAREHDGDLTAKSIVGMGTTFTLTLPVVDEFRIGEPRDNTNAERNVFLFTLDNSITAAYFKQGIPLKVSIQRVDNVDRIPGNFSRSCDLFICDAKFTGKVELYKTAELCQQDNVPYVMINCGSMEYQLSELYNSAAACFKETATLARVLETALKGQEIAG
ncbi:MAG: ATP-binding protein, partial [bacterium]|nr:ATP-binding protein [bacterium]